MWALCTIFTVTGFPTSLLFACQATVIDDVSQKKTAGSKLRVWNLNSPFAPLKALCMIPLPRIFPATPPAFCDLQIEIMSSININSERKCQQKSVTW